MRRVRLFPSNGHVGRNRLDVLKEPGLDRPTDGPLQDLPSETRNHGPLEDGSSPRSPGSSPIRWVPRTAPVSIVFFYYCPYSIFFARVDRRCRSDRRMHGLHIDTHRSIPSARGKNTFDPLRDFKIPFPVCHHRLRACLYVVQGDMSAREGRYEHQRASDRRGCARRRWNAHPAAREMVAIDPEIFTSRRSKDGEKEALACVGLPFRIRRLR